MDSPIINIAGLCSGVGMLDLAVGSALEYLGFKSRLALLCEWESYAASCLLARMEESTLESCPIWCGSLAELNATPFRGLVDVLCAGLPCQPYSCAGKQRGTEDERSYGDGDGPIPNFLRIVGECRPALVFIENVPPFVTGLRDKRTGRRNYPFLAVGAELSGMGYTIEDPLFVTAESVGASHKRERVFILAHNQESRSWRLSKSNGWHNAADVDGQSGVLAVASGGRQRIVRESSERNGQPDGGDQGTLGNSERQNCVRQPVASQRGQERRTSFDGPSESLADAASSGSKDEREVSAQGRQSNASASCGVFAPGPSADWRSIPEYLWPATQPGFRLLVDGRPLVLDEGRTDQLRCGGNGCVPLAAAVALVVLIERSSILKT